ncbi:MAG: hypothetical protein HQK65_11130 [Desulfamplus sp.]|nr:hypothetical protein [Desulfamplus sp.]
MKIVDIIKKTFCLQDKSMWINVCGLVVDNKRLFTILLTTGNYPEYGIIKVNYLYHEGIEVFTPFL